MIQTKTTWEDSGYDCDHCGGVILKRIDYESGQPKQECYQCRQCSCQWSLDGEPLRIGNHSSCRSAQRMRAEESVRQGGVISRPILIVLAVAALLLVVRFGGFMALRFLIPLALGAFVVFSLVRYGREQEWW